MKRCIRNMVVALVFSPLIVLIYLTSLLVGKTRAATIWGPLLTHMAKSSLRYWVPRIDSADDFDEFSARMKANFRLWRPLYDIEIAEETGDTLKLHVGNCPFCEVFNAAGLTGMSPYICKGDWDKAHENRAKWVFERRHQIGTGDSFCDHTYKRKK